MADAEPKIFGKAASCQMSGHVSYTTQQLAFYGMVDRRIEKQAAMRKSGMIEVKNGRNPLRAERTPRREDYGHFDYSIPTGRKELKNTFDKWSYPETDNGLMGMFQSQKYKYENSANTLHEFKMKLESEERGKHHQAEASAEQQRREREAILAQRTAQNICTARSEILDPGPTPRTLARAAEGNLSQQSITNFRILANDNPEVLEKWRAERAAKYLMKTKKPLDPPHKRKLMHNKPMFPSGYFHDQEPDYADRNYSPPKAHHKVRGALVPHGKNKGEDIKTMKASLTDLLSSLDTTEKELERQKLTLNLNARKKASYEAPRTGRSSRLSSRAGDLNRTP